MGVVVAIAFFGPNKPNPATFRPCGVLKKYLYLSPMAGLGTDDQKSAPTLAWGG
jgi:hypothetical protein